MNDAPDRELARAYRASLDAAGCPDDERLAALVVGELTGDERADVADHVVRCARCAASYRDLLELHAAAGAEPSPARSPLASRAWWLSAGVAALLVLGVALFMPRPTAPDPAVLRGGGEVAAWPAGTLDESPLEFRWPAQALADGYTVELFDREARPIWSAASAEPRLVLDPDQRALIDAGGGYYWIVRVGGNVATSKLGPYRFRVE